ncbi:MAG: hypothetical protein U0822_13115 [Anaerolineae bacterium]
MPFSLFRKAGDPYQRVGTMMMYVPRDGSQPVRPGQDYFLVQIKSAQAAFDGAIWDSVRNLVVTSSVNLNSAILGNQEMRALQRTLSVDKNQATQLGLSRDLIALVPATMPRTTASVDFVIDRENRLAGLGSIINSDSFLTVVSLAPGVAPVARILSKLSSDIIRAYIPAEEQSPILQFTADFNIDGTANGLQDGYYVILGTADADNPLPDTINSVEVLDTGLRIDGQPVTQLSYIILSVVRVPTRPASLSDGAPWAAKLREAEDTAQLTNLDPFADDAARKEAWDKCKKLIQEASVLVAADPNYLPQDGQTIWRASYQKCVDLLSAAPSGTRDLAPPTVDTAEDRRAMGIPVDADMRAVLAHHAEKVMAAERALEDAGLAP